jgi:hypothetical protein
MHCHEPPPPRGISFADRLAADLREVKAQGSEQTGGVVVAGHGRLDFLAGSFSGLGPTVAGLGTGYSEAVLCADQ